ncbi:MAG: GrpB family protein [Clostridia bacterium]|nr:GrpB family protein [Clostridia bacterium]
MGKKLLEMCLEELWLLFPIFLEQHKDCWKEWYFEEECLLKRALSSTEKISHIGSTAIPSIWAKPIVDILVEIPKEGNLLDYKAKIINCGYICMSQSENGMSFNKGYTENGFAERVFHLHLRYTGDNSELYFRDYLIEHSDIAKQYEELKLRLWKEYEHNRDAYTNAKTEFVKEYTKKARILYGNKY